MELDESLVSELKQENNYYQHRSLLVISKICGRVALGVGWGIFFIWSVGLAITGEPAMILMSVGFCWIAIGFVLGLIGLICLISFMIVNKRKPKTESIKSLAVLLAGIPSVFIIIFLVSLTSKF